jgi:UDP-N-acetylglucosamine--N-acetylmuramyl-(pentapeptide) pyrophosphoryl-undecaprenol N-acetylglucosamine transferase
MRKHDIERVLLTGGGTAGHVNPALAIGSIFSKSSTRFLFVGVRGRVEEEVVPRQGIPIRFVRASGYPGNLSAAMALFLLNLLVGTVQSLFILFSFRPHIIVATGGYVSAPVLMAASLLKKLRLSRTRVYMHEQNAVPGKLNRLMGRFADTVFVTFPETLHYFTGRGLVVGYPLRKSIRPADREAALRELDFKIPEGRKVVLVFGGSQGSRNINRAVVDSLQYLLPYKDSLFIVHGFGLSNNKDYKAESDTANRLKQIYSEERLGELDAFYASRPFFYHIEYLYAVCDLVVARAGAGSLNEISAMGLPALIIPKANLPGDHQVQNARSMERTGAVEILYEQILPFGNHLREVIDGKTLAEKLVRMLENSEGLKRMGQLSRSFFNQDALERIERHIEGGEMTQTNGSGGSLLESPQDSSLPGNATLLGLLEKEASKHRHDYSPSHVIPRPQDLEYLKNRACSLLVHSSWQNRNLGIKLLGLLGAREKIPAMLALLFEREPVSWFKKMFGGDFKQVGFIRRNIFAALVRLDELSPEVEKALQEGLADPYYEVRAQAAHAVAFFGPRLQSTRTLVPALKDLLEDQNVDVVLAAAEALGNIGSKSDALPALLAMWDTRLWKVRSAVLRGILHLVKRGEIIDPEALEEDVAKFILTSTDFRPHFEIKAVYRHLMEMISKEKEKRPSP